MTTTGTATMTIEEQMQALQKRGFVRVDGLRYLGAGQGRMTKAAETPVSEARLRYEGNNGMLAVMLPNGQVWIRFGEPTNSRQFPVNYIPNLGGSIEQGMFVPCSNGEQLDPMELLHRVGNPYWEPRD